MKRANALFRPVRQGLSLLFRCSFTFRHAVYSLHDFDPVLSLCRIAIHSDHNRFSILQPSHSTSVESASPTSKICRYLLYPAIPNATTAVRIAITTNTLLFFLHRRLLSMTAFTSLKPASNCRIYSSMNRIIHT